MKCLLCLVFLFCVFLKIANASSLDDGLKAYYQKQWSQCNQDFKTALTQNPTDSLALVYYMVSSVWKGTSEHLIRDLEDQLIDNPNNQAVDLQLGFAYYTQAFYHGEKPDKALAELYRAARMGPSSLVHTGIGMIDFDVGNLTRAKKEFSKAMDMNPKDVLAYEYMGRILLSFDNDPQDALPYFQQEEKLAPNYPDSHYYLASALDALGDTEGAIAEYERTYQEDPLGVRPGVDAQIALGDLYQRNKQFDDARKSFQIALSFDPNNAAIKQRLTELDKEPKPKKH